MDDLVLASTDAPDAGDVALIERELVAFNAARSMPYDRRPLCVFLRDGAGRAVGGVTGYTN